jgi:hypothetical protein
MKTTFLTTLAAAAFLIPAAPATANTYDVYSCWAGAGTFRNPNASSAAWAKDQAAAGGRFTAHEDCATNSANGAMTVISLSGYPAGNGQYARLAFTAPEGSTVYSVDLWRNAWSYGTGTGASSQRNYAKVLAGGSPLSGGTDADGTADVAWGTRGTGNTTAHGIISANLMSLNASSGGANTVEYRVGCGWSAGCPTSSPAAPAPNYFAAGVDVYGARVTIQDTLPPSLAVSESGLFAAGDINGIRPVAISTATDVSGIKKLAVFADGATTPVGVLDFEQDVNRCNWANPAPCQNVTDTEIPVDTTQLADGEHAFVVKAYDAADNERASTTHYVTVKNATPAPPTDGTGGTGGAGQSGGTDPATGTGSNTGLPNGIDQSTGGGTGGSGPTTTTPKLLVTFDQNGKSKVTAKYARMITVRGHLTDGSGGPIIAAQVDYSALSTRAGARVQSLGAVRTDSSGTFTLMVATKLGSRQLRFAYSPQIGGAVAATARAQLDVTAPISMKVGPKRVRNKHSVTFRGRLGAGPIPRKGKLISLQVVVDGRWHTFAVVRSTKRGNFKYRYRFKRTYGRVTYRFRALSRYEAAYPFVAGHSKTARVRVN